MTMNQAKAPKHLKLKNMDYLVGENIKSYDEIPNLEKSSENLDTIVLTERAEPIEETPFVFFARVKPPNSNNLKAIMA